MATTPTRRQFLHTSGLLVASVAAISVDGRTISETAQDLGMNETAVRVSLHRGLRAITRRFGRG